jgi:hypothetical protein
MHRCPTQGMHSSAASGKCTVLVWPAAGRVVWPWGPPAEAPAAARRPERPGRGERLPPWTQSQAGTLASALACRARCGSCGGARVMRRHLPSTGTPSGCLSWGPSTTAMAWTGPSSGCQPARFTWRSSGPRRHRTRAAGWTSSCSTCPMLPPGSRCRPGSERAPATGALRHPSTQRQRLQLVPVPRPPH